VSDRPTVDVLIVSYNTRDYLAACLDSLMRHTPPDSGPQVRVRVFDNASSDGSADMVARSFPDVSLVASGRNVGFAAANNRLVADSGADYVMLLNPDTLLTQDIITPLWRIVESDGEIAVAGPRLNNSDGSLQPSSERLPSLRYELACSFHGTKLDRLLRPFVDFSATIRDTREANIPMSTASRTVEFLWATCWLLRTSDARHYGPFDERFTMYDEDLDLCRRLSDDGRLAFYVPSVSVIHVGGASSDPRRKQRLMRVGRRRYYRRHGGISQALAFSAIVNGADAAKGLLTRLRGS
jgi:GT2 family glycosyltransferase